MDSYIILLKGVNVGGNNLLPMKTLKFHLEQAGFDNVKTYIQSGNLVLRSSVNPEISISSLIKTKFGLSPELIVLSAMAFNSSVSNNPYNEYQGKFVHLYFCKKLPRVDTVKLQQLASDTEHFKLIGHVFYLHAPNGIGRSKLIANIDSCLGVPATGRNLNTVDKLVAMLKDK